MKLSKEQVGSLKSALKLIYSVLKGDTHVVIDTERGLLHGVDSDLCLAVNAAYLKVIPIPLAGAPKFCIEAKKFHSVLSHLRGEVTLGVAGTSLELSAGTARFVLPTSSALPPPLKPFNSHLTRLPAKALIPLLEKATGVAEDGSYQSVLIEGMNNDLRAVSTDGSRLVVTAHTLDQPTTLGSMLISSRAAAAIEQLPAETLTISSDESSLIVDTGEIRLVARKTSAKFPEWQKVIPTMTKSEYKMEAADMLAALERIDSVVDAKDASTFLLFQNDKVLLQLHQSYGQASDEVAVLGRSAEPDFDPDFDTVEDTIHMKLSFLLSFFNLVKTGEVAIRITDNKMPVLFEAGALQFVMAPLPGPVGKN